MTRILLLAWSILAVTLICSRHVHAAHSRRRIVVRVESEPRYDRSITTFSPDGRLKQVEYGLEASKRGQTVAAFGLEDAVVVAVASTSKVYRIDAHVYLFTSGLVGDGRFLASLLQNSCQNHRLENGEAPTLTQVSRFAAGLQHQLTRGMGVRPLGCTAIIVGVSDGSPQLFQTDPGGIIEQCRYCAAGKGRDKAMQNLNDLNQESTNEETQLILEDVAEKVAVAALKASDEEEEGKAESVDVWIVQPNEKCRGGTHMLCIKNVTSASTENLRDHLATSVAKLL